MNGGTIVGTAENTANYGGGVFVSGGEFIMNDGSISGNTVTQSGGGVFVNAGNFTMKGGTIGGTTANTATQNGGGVFVQAGTFNMTGTAVIQGNEATGGSSHACGGGVYVNGGEFTMTGTTIIQDNKANSTNGHACGGGVYVNGTGKFDMGDTATIQGNNASTTATNSAAGGGGVYVNGGTFTMTGTAKIQGNTTTSANPYTKPSGGGGVFVIAGGTFIMSGGTIGSSTDANEADLGGGVYVGVNTGTGEKGSFTMGGGTITGNTATQNGGGVYVSSTGSFTLGPSSAAASSPVVSGNTKTGNSTNNVYLDNTSHKTLFITGKLEKTVDSGNIGISLAIPGEEFTLGWSDSTVPTFFFSDDTKRTVALSGSELSLNLVFVEGGSYELNSQSVTLSDFWISPYEVTQKEFETIMTGNLNSIEPKPSSFTGNTAAEEVQERRPVDTVRWFEAIVYCNLLSMKEGLTPCYTIKDSTNPADWGVRPDSQIYDNYNCWNSVTCNFEADGYRLPTAAEWEYAARGGNPKDSSWNNTYSGSDTLEDVAWYSNNSDSKTHEVGKKQANALGLYDMSGNLKEWCWNRKSEDNDRRVMRGGYYSLAEGGCQVTAVDSNFPISQGPDQGFRVVRSAR